MPGKFEKFLKDVKEASQDVEVMTSNSMFYAGNVIAYDNEVIILKSELLSMVYVVNRNQIVTISCVEE